MKLGVKIYPDNPEYARKIKDHVDFYEVMCVEGANYGFMSTLEKPLVLHAEDFKYQTNLANPANNIGSEHYLKFIFDLLKRYGAEHIIMNPGIRFNNKCTTDNMKVLFRKFPVRKIFIENQPPLKSRTYPFFCRSYDEVRIFLKNYQTKFCFDFDHAFASAFFFDKEPFEFCRNLLDLKPEHIHISNGKNLSYLDTHLHFDEGDFNMVAMKEMMPKDTYVTVDTVNDLQEQIEELKFLREPEYRG